VGLLAIVAIGTVLWISCGQVYRPVVIPVNSTPPNPANFHAVFGISTNVESNPGTAFQIDVSGDSKIGAANMGINPTHGAMFPTNARVFVASAGSVVPGNADVVTSFTPAIGGTLASGLGPPVTYTYPNVAPNETSAITSISESGTLVTVNVSSPLNDAFVGGPLVISNVSIGGYNGNFVISSVNGASTTIQYTNSISGLAATSGGTAAIPLPTFCSYQPDYVETKLTSAVFVANYGFTNRGDCALASTDSVAFLNPINNTIANIAYLPAGSRPVALAETPNGQNLYVLNQGDGVSASTVMNLSPTDLSLQATIPVGINPTWAVVRKDGLRVYVLTQGDGKLIPIDPATNTILPSQTNLSVGAGANSVLYDQRLNRLYVTNPTNGNVYVFSATGGLDLSGNANDTPKLLATISMSAGTNPPCPAGCSPVSVSALPDGSRFYVASYQEQAACADPNVGAVPCIIPTLTVFDAPSMTVKTPPSSPLAPVPTLALLSSPPFAAGTQSTPAQFAVPTLASCTPVVPYAPGAARFRMYTTASADSSHVYVSICDAGVIADVTTTTSSNANGTNAGDRLVTDLVTPFSAAPPGTNGQPPPQNPVFLLTGQ